MKESKMAAASQPPTQSQQFKLQNDEPFMTSKIGQQKFYFDVDSYCPLLHSQPTHHPKKKLWGIKPIFFFPVNPNKVAYERRSFHVLIFPFPLYIDGILCPFYLNNCSALLISQPND
ncbi:hypothetical protein L6164_012814 [Bauhinia variegata]|uniref:Uncharacterized protein n=1 Tax=Bauhinia variegata TaxID=167791 RepID=A0ACB9PCR2_BAUVA|nr:hypothetical protein L6164_012814 [Bauhinia variegata]